MGDTRRATRATADRVRPGVATAACGLLALLPIHAVQAAIYTVTNTADSGAGSLRQAILDANLTVDADQIHFAIPGSGVKTIALLTQLPPISRSLTIDGYTQTGAISNTLHTHEGGSNAVLQVEVTTVTGGFHGLYIEAANGVILTVQGLNMHGFITCLSGAPIAGSSQLRSFGNFLCSNIQGDAPATGVATVIGVSTMRTPSFIGGDLPHQRNLISGCSGAGVSIDGDAQLRGNLIGTDASASQPIGNGSNSNLRGVVINNTEASIGIGAAQASARNIISGNNTFGIVVVNQSTSLHYANLTILGNYIGTDWQGTQALPNGYATPNLAAYGGGIQLNTFTTDPTPLIIGGFGLDEGNLIAFNHGSGIKAATNSVGEGFDSRGNAIHDHTFGGATNIDVGEFGITPNDAGDADLGANGQQNKPELLNVSESGDQATVRYRVDTLPAHATYPLRIDFYVGEADGSGFWLAQDSYPAAVAGQVREFTFTLPPGIRAFPLTATASSENHTSELATVYVTVFRDGFEADGM
jgi:hypothetical protein